MPNMPNMPKNIFRRFRIDDTAIRYSDFAPRLFNFCLSLGMKPNSIMPSRAFCADENQGYPIILLAKHFGTFPFNHGRVGGIVATDRHGPHAHHGKDVVIVQASHVGYEQETNEFGVYRRLQTENHDLSSDCGAICDVLHWYKEEYDFSCQQISLKKDNGKEVVIIDNQLLNMDRDEGLFLDMQKMVADLNPVSSYSTAKSFIASNYLVKRMAENWPDGKTPINNYLFAELFHFTRLIDKNIASGILNHNLIEAMPRIISSHYPALTAAQINTQVEFDRTFRTIVKEKAYRDKKIVFISGIHIDISPRQDQPFPLTNFVPWAAYVQNEKGVGYTLEQHEIFTALKAQSAENPHKIDLTEAIQSMKKEPEIHLRVDAD